MMFDPQSALVEVGYVAKAHGVRGQILVVVHNPSSAALDNVERLVVVERVFAVDSAHRVAKGHVVKLARVDDRDAAQALVGQPVSVSRDQLGLDEDEVLLVDLIGFAAETTEGMAVGYVSAVIPGAQDRLVIVQGDEEFELPLVDALVPLIDAKSKRVVIDPPEGLPRSRRVKAQP